MIEVPLHNRRKERVGIALVDGEDGWVLAYNWTLNNYGYVKRQNGRATFLLHREILGLVHGDPRRGDHKDGNPLDCRRGNLRICTHAENNQNTSGKARSTSRFRGVSWDSGRQRWIAQVVIGRRRVLYARYDNELDAARAASAARAAHLSHTNEARHAVA